MSLLNDVLEDLDRRNTPSVSVGSLSGLRPSPRVTRRSPRRAVRFALLSAAGVTLGIGAAYANSIRGFAAGDPALPTALDLPSVSTAPPPSPRDIEPESPSRFVATPPTGTQQLANLAETRAPAREIVFAPVRKQMQPASRREFAEWAHVDGLVLAEHGENEDAVAALKRGLAVDPTRNAIRGNLVALLVRVDRLGEAQFIYFGFEIV